jgi:hypothetical protein
VNEFAPERQIVRDRPLHGPAEIPVVAITSA